MDAEGRIFIIGIAVGVVVCSLVMHGISQGDLDNCAEEHNIYECEWVTVPVEPDP